LPEFYVSFIPQSGVVQLPPGDPIAGGLAAGQEATRETVTLRPLSEGPLSKSLNLNLDIHTRGQVQPHEQINRFRVRIQHIDQTVVRPNLKVLVRILIDKSGAAYCKPFYASWQGYWANYSGTSSLGGLYNALGRLI
jgi:hypothetical protein